MVYFRQQQTEPLLHGRVRSRWRTRRTRLVVSAALSEQGLFLAEDRDRLVE